MAKKKKPVVRKGTINRGFATTSTPKRKPEPEALPVASDATEVANLSAHTQGSAGNNGHHASENAGIEATEDVLQLDCKDVELKQLVERLSQRAKKEIARLWKAIEYDQRMSQSSLILQVDPIIYWYASPTGKPPSESSPSEERGEDVTTSLPGSDAASTPLPTSLLDEEKLHLKALVTFGLLQQLGFTLRQAKLALSATAGLYDLEQCVAELVARLTLEELKEVEKRQAGASYSAAPAAEEVEKDDESIPPRHPAYSFNRSVVTRGLLASKNKKSVKSDSSQGINESSSSAVVSENDTLDLTQKLREVNISSTSLLMRLEEDISAGQEGEGPLDTLKKPSLAWATVRLAQIQLERLNGQQAKLLRGGANPTAAHDLSRLDALSKRLDEIMQEAQRARNFDAAVATRLLEECKAECENVLNLRRNEGKSAEANERKRWEDKELMDPGTDGTGGFPLESQSSSEMKEKHDEESEQDDVEDMFGGMLDETPTEVTDTSTGATIHLRALPATVKGGRTPRSLLFESLRRFDTAAHVRFDSVHTGGRIFRSRLTMRWSGSAGKKSSQSYMDVFQLTGEATESQSAAEDMLATVALNCVDRDRCTFRSLSGPYREWYDEIEERRKAEQISQNVETIRTISGIISHRLQEIASKKAQSKQALTTRAGDSALAPIIDAETHIGALAYGVVQPLSAEAALQQMEKFKTRTLSPQYQKMLTQRQSLPIFKHRDQILDVLESNQIFVLSGETGCGKSTQVPAYILEECLSRGQPCKIYCTEPRRISAISLAERVSQELGEPKSAVGGDQSLVGYSIRLESHVGREARLIYATSGILLRMLEGTSVNEVTHIIIDEVHERSIESDFLLIILKTLLAHRKDLKVILMSATLDAERISAYCGGCPIVSVPGRTFPVQINFLEDAVEATGYAIEDDSPYALRLRRDKFGRKMDAPDNKARLQSTEEDDAVSDDDDDDSDRRQNSGSDAAATATFSLKGQRYSRKTISTLDRMDEYVINHDLIIALLEHVCFSPDYEQFSSATLVFLPGIQDIRKLHDLLLSHKAFGSQAFVVSPLHSTLSSEEQSAVFNIPPHGVRKIVISTNIAETGVTIPDVTCVIDSGRQREMRFDEKRQTSRLVDCFVAKSNAKQRRGRAGRVQEGLCFHLFTKLRHDRQMADHPLPEMLRLSLQDLALKLKIMKIRIGNSIGDALCQALDPPPPVNVMRAVSALVEVGALTTTEEITPLGRRLARIPLDVHMGKFLLIATLFKSLDAALTIAAALNSKSPFLTPFGREAEADAAKASFKVGHSDFLTIANAFNCWRRSVKQNHHFVFCRKSFLSHQALQQIEELRQQYMAFLLDSGFVQLEEETKKTILNIRYRSGRGIKLMETPEALDVNGNSIAALHAALAAGLYPKLLTIDARSGQLRTLGNNQPASVHPSSVNFRLKLGPGGHGGGAGRALPESCNHLAYFNIVQSRKLYARETAPVSDLALVLFCGDADFRFSCRSVYLDRNRIRWRVSRKMSKEGDAGVIDGGGMPVVEPLVALRSLRILRERVAGLITTSFRSPRRAWTEEEHLALDVALRGIGAFANEADKLTKSEKSAV